MISYDVIRVLPLFFRHEDEDALDIKPPQAATKKEKSHKHKHKDDRRRDKDRDRDGGSSIENDFSTGS